MPTARTPVTKKFRRVYIELSNVCNLKCGFCPAVERDRRVMTPAFFRRVLAEVAPLTEEVCLHLMGEPLGHPQLGDIIATCTELAVPVNLTTNGVLLHGERRDIVLSPIVRQLNVSVHSFEANFQGQDVAPYMHRLFRLTRAAMDVRPDLYVNFRLWDLVPGASVSNESAAILRLIEEEFCADFATLKVDLRRRKGFCLAGRIYVHFDSRFEWPSVSAPVRGRVGTCHGLTQHIGIHADGTVVPCCLDKEAVIRLGDLTKSSLQDILASPRAEAMRCGFARDRLVEDLCQRCTFITRFDRRVRRRAAARVDAESSD